MSAEGDCPCRPLPATGDPKGHVAADALGKVVLEAPKTKKRRAPKQLKGRFCVVSAKTGKPFNCFHSEETAERMAKKLGDRFRVKKK